MLHLRSSRCQRSRAVLGLFFGISPPADLVAPRNLRVSVAWSREGHARVRFAIGVAVAMRQRGRKFASTSSPVAPPITAAILKNLQSRQRSAGHMTGLSYMYKARPQSGVYEFSGEKTAKPR